MKQDDCPRQLQDREEEEDVEWKTDVFNSKPITLENMGP